MCPATPSTRTRKYPEAFIRSYKWLMGEHLYRGTLEGYVELMYDAYVCEQVRLHKDAKSFDEWLAMHNGELSSKGGISGNS